MLCIGNNQPTEEFPVEANEAFQDTEDRGESAERVDWNQAQYKPEKKTSEATFIIWENFDDRIPCCSDAKIQITQEESAWDRQFD